MSGPAIVWYLLKTDSALIAQVPVVRIKAGVLPLGIALPAISVMRIGGDTHKTVAMTETPQLHIERVQVSWLTRDDEQGYVKGKQIDSLVIAALPNTKGSVNGFAVDAILPEGPGPDIPFDADHQYQSSRDFIVKYRA